MSLNANIITDILKREGGFVDHPADKGGPTNYGITAQTLGEWRKLGRAASAEEVRRMTADEARVIYHHRYIIEPGFDCITYAPLLNLVVDSGVISGPRRATQWLQMALGVTPDGIIGPKTRAAIGQMDNSTIFKRVLASRIRFFGRLITSDHSQAVFAAGWMNRCAGFIEAEL